MSFIATSNAPQRSSPEAAIQLLLLPLMMVLFISTLDQTIIATAIGRIGTALGDVADAPWVATSYLLTSAVTTLIFGKLGDMLGRKVMLQWSIAIFVAGSALCAASPSMFWLIAARALQGIGGGGLNSLVMAIVGDLVPPRERARHQATIGIVPAIAIVVGPVLGGLIVDHWSWTWIFLINVPLGALALWMISSRLHLPIARSTRRLDIGGASLAVLFTTCALLITTLAGTTFAWASWQIVGLGVVTVAALLAYVFVEHRAAEPITPLSLFGNSIFVISAALFFLSTAALFVGLLFVPLMLQSVFGHSAFVAGASIVPLLLGLIVASMVSGTLISKGARYRTFPIVGALLSGAGLGMLGFIRLDTSLWTVVLALVGLGSGLGLFIQVAVLAGQNAVAHRQLGVATGTLNFFKTMGGAAGAAVLGAVLAAGLAGAVTPVLALAAFRHVFRDAATLMVSALLLAVFLREKPLSEEMVAVAEGRVDVPEY